MASDFDKYVGARVRYYRIKRGFSQDAISKELGKTFQQMQKYESGKNRLSVEVIYKLMGLLNFTWEDITPPLEGAPHEAAQLEGNSKLCLKLMAGLKKLSVRDQKIVGQLVKMMTS